MGGKSGGAGQTYDYYGTLAGVVCLGTVSELVSIILNGQEVWPQNSTPWVLGGTCTAGVLYVFDAQTWTCTNTHVASLANAPGSGLEGWTEYTYVRGAMEVSTDFSIVGSDGTPYGTLRLYWGTAGQTVDFYLQAANNDGGISGNLGSGDTHPSYAGVCYFVLIDFLLGQEIQSGPNLEIVVRRKPNQALLTGGPAAITDGQANLAAVMVELLTDNNCLGLPTTMVDTTSFQAVGNYLDTNQANYNASVLIDSSESLRSVLDKFLQMIDGYIRFNSTSQKIELGIYQHGVTPGGGTYVTITADLLTKHPQFKSTSWQGTFSRATVRYNSRQLNYQQTSVQCDDPRAYFVLGTAREQSLDRPWIAREGQAWWHGRETLRVIGHAQLTGQVEVRREFGRAILPGNYVLVDVDLEPGSNTLYQFFRVTQVQIPPTGPITLDLMADNTLAPVPWTQPAPIVPPIADVVPSLASFRVLEVPTVLSADPGAITVLAQRQTNLITGCQVYFDTSPTGTFSANLGSFTIFAAKAVLYSAVAATDATITVTVDTTQADAFYFTSQYSATQQANDTMLLFVVNIVPSGGDAGEVQESGGYQLLEICSVGAQTLVSAGRYQISVLRGRKNTAATAFTTANTEVWLIQADTLAFFNTSVFNTIRANRLIGGAPAYAQFRLCPFTAATTLALSAATSEQFRFPLNSSTAPSLTLATPGGFTIATTPAAYPYGIRCSGTWTSPDGDLVEVKVLLRLSSDTTDRVVWDQLLSPCASAAFDVTVQPDAPGTWTIKLIARDQTNYQTERDITATLGGSGPVCAAPDIYDSAGNLLRPGAQSSSGVYIPTEAVPFGPLTIKCSTPGATIQFLTNGRYVDSNVIKSPFLAQWQNYSATVQPFCCLLLPFAGTTSPPTSFSIQVVASAAGYSQSAVVLFQIPLFN